MNSEISKSPRFKTIGNLYVKEGEKKGMRKEHSADHSNKDMRNKLQVYEQEKNNQQDISQLSSNVGLKQELPEVKLRAETL